MCGFWSPCLAEVKADTKNSSWMHKKFVLTWRILIDAPCLFLSLAFRDSSIRNSSPNTGLSQIFRNVWSVGLFKTSDVLFLSLLFLPLTTIRYHSVLFNRYSWDRIFKLRNAITYSPSAYTRNVKASSVGVMLCGVVELYDVSKQPTALTSEAEHIQYVVNFHQTTQRHIPEDCILRRYRRENVRFRTVPLVVRFVIE